LIIILTTFIQSKIAFLSLEPLSCIVALIRDLENKSFSFSAITHSQQDSDLTLPTVLPINHIGMNNFPEQPPAFNCKVRG